MESLASKVESATPNQEGVQLLRDTKVALLVGITGAGKNSVLNEMVKTGNYHDLVTSVTRQPRSNNGVPEQDGVDYHFLTEDQALAAIDAGEYVEVSMVHNRIYGVTVSEVRRAHDIGKIAIADVTVEGVDKYKSLSDNVVAIFLLPPNYDEWQRRVQKRYPTVEEFHADWPNRRTSAIHELEAALEKPYYHFVINDSLDDAVDACLQIVGSDDKFYRKDDEKRLVARDILNEIRERYEN